MSYHSMRVRLFSFVRPPLSSVRCLPIDPENPMNLVARLALVISLLGAFATWLFRGDLDSPAAFLRCARVCFAQRSHLPLDFLFLEGVWAYLLHVSSSRSATRRTATPHSAAEGNVTENS